MGVLGDYPPTDPAGFTTFARSLEFPDIGDALHGSAMLGRVAGFRFPASVWRRYDRLRRLPAGLVIVGDALCSLNPIYGQGVTVAALQALALREHTKQGHLRSGALMGELANVVAPAWKMSTSADLAFPGVRGKRPAVMRIANAYIARVQAAAEHDPNVAIAFLRVAGMVDPPQRLFGARVANRTLRTTK